MVWLFLGLDNWVDIHAVREYDLDHDGHIDKAEAERVREVDVLGELVVTYKGRITVECLDPYDDDDHALQYSFGVVVASVNTVLLLALVFWGLFRFRAIKRSFEPRTLQAWYKQQLEKKQNEE